MNTDNIINLIVDCLRSNKDTIDKNDLYGLKREIESLLSVKTMEEYYSSKQNC